MKSVALVFAIVMTLATAPVVLAETPIWSMDVEGVAVDGSVAMVTVSNGASVPASALLEVEVAVAGMSTRTSVIVTVPAGGSATVPVAFPGPVSTVLDVTLEEVP